MSKKLLFIACFFLFNLSLFSQEIEKSTWGNTSLSIFKEHGNFWRNYYGKREKKLFVRQIKTAKQYEKLIKKIFLTNGLPEDLFYVGLIESGYSTSARSTADAVGPWQFMQGTAESYGLKISRNIDERRNIIKSTQAAARYFADLYNIFGNWEMALCAYNRGEYGMIRAIRKAKSRDYLELIRKKLIPKETQHYIAKIVAAKHVYESPLDYDLNIEEEELLLQAVSTAYNAREKGNDQVLYRVKRGDTLKSIAGELGIQIDEIMKANKLKVSDKNIPLPEKQQLIIPI